MHRSPPVSPSCMARHPLQGKDLGPGDLAELNEALLGSPFSLSTVPRREARKEAVRTGWVLFQCFLSPQSPSPRGHLGGPRKQLLRAGGPHLVAVAGPGGGREDQTRPTGEAKEKRGAGPSRILHPVPPKRGFSFFFSFFSLSGETQLAVRNVN